MSGALTFADQLLEPKPFLLAQPDHLFLDGNLLAGHESSPSLDRDGSDSDCVVKGNDVSH
jgi:hypothetical protein